MTRPDACVLLLVPAAAVVAPKRERQSQPVAWPG